MRPVLPFSGPGPRRALPRVLPPGSLSAVLAALLLGSCIVEPPSPSSPPGRTANMDPTRPAFDLYVLGVAQDGGMPHVGCTRECCETARRTGLRRFPAALGIRSRADDRLLLIEATPAVEAQLALLHALSGVRPLPRRPVDALLLTHAHIGHYLGLAFFGREVAGVKGLPLWVGPRMAAFLKRNGPWSQCVALGQLALRDIPMDRPFEPLPGLEIRAIPVPHRDEFSETLAFKIRGPSRTVLFVPDIDAWDRHRGLLESLLEGVDVAYVDGTFYDGRELGDRDLSLIPHPLVLHTVERLAAEAARRPGWIRFLHLNHTNPLFADPSLRRDLEARGFRIAERGEHLEL